MAYGICIVPVFYVVLSHLFFRHMDSVRPSVSVVMCTYNGAPYIPEQLDSILRQTYPIKEIIIQDDQSTDSTMEVLRAYAEKDERIRVYAVDERRGINHNFITAIDKARGDLIAWSDQDDVWLPDKVEKLVDLLVREDLWISFHLTKGFVGECPQNDDDYDRRVPNFGLERAIFIGPVSGHTMLFRKEVHRMILEKVPKESLDLVCSAFCYDSILAIVANAYGKVGVVPELLDLHRRVPTSVTKMFGAKKFRRSGWNAVRQIVRCLNPIRRRRNRPHVLFRMNRMLLLLDCFPDATQTGRVRRLIGAYKNPGRFFLFPRELIRNRDRILYSKEEKDWIAKVRALLFEITYQDYWMK